VAHELEARVHQQITDVAFAPGEQVIHAKHVVPLLEKLPAKMRSNESGATGYKCGFVNRAPHRVVASDFRCSAPESARVCLNSFLDGGEQDRGFDGLGTHRRNRQMGLTATEIQTTDAREYKRSAGHRFQPCLEVSQTDEQAPPVARERYRDGGELAAFQVVGGEAAPWAPFVPGKAVPWRIAY